MNNCSYKTWRFNKSSYQIRNQQLLPRYLANTRQYSRDATILLSYSLQSRSLKTNYIFFGDLLPYIISRSQLSGNNADIAYHSGHAAQVLNCLRSLQRWNREMESYSRLGCLCAVFLCSCSSVCRLRPCDGRILCRRSPTNCLRIRDWKRGQGSTKDDGWKGGLMDG
jgi:hypothetical protein